MFYVAATFNGATVSYRHLNILKMANKKSLHDISEGVSYDDFKNGVQATFDSIVLPQIKTERKLRASEKGIKRSPDKINYLNCQSPY